MKNILNIFYAIIVAVFCIQSSFAQATKAEKKAEKIAELKRLITSKSYVFQARMAMPMASNASVQVSGALMPNMGNVINDSSVPLTSSYDLKLSNDTLTAYLPYFGVAYSAPAPGTTEGGVKFTSTKFDYKVTEKKNGTFEIFFKPLDLQPRAPSDVQRMTLSVSEGGYASLQITLLNRQPITFTGSLGEVKLKPLL